MVLVRKPEAGIGEMRRWTRQSKKTAKKFRKFFRRFFGGLIFRETDLGPFFIQTNETDPETLKEIRRFFFTPRSQ